MAAGDFLDGPSTGNGAFRNIAVGVACALLLHTTDKNLFSLMIKIFIYLFIYLFSWQLAVCSHFFFFLSESLVRLRIFLGIINLI